MRVVGVHTFMAAVFLMLDIIALKLMRRTPLPRPALTFSRKYTVRRTGGGTTLLQQQCSFFSPVCGFKYFHVDDVRKLGQIHGLLPGTHRRRSVCQIKEMRGGNSSMVRRLR